MFLFIKKATKLMNNLQSTWFKCSCYLFASNALSARVCFSVLDEYILLTKLFLEFPQCLCESYLPLIGIVILSDPLIFMSAHDVLILRVCQSRWVTYHFTSFKMQLKEYSGFKLSSSVSISGKLNFHFSKNLGHYGACNVEGKK